MGSVIQRVRPKHFSKKLLKYIFMKSYIYEIGFHKYMVNNLKGLNRVLKD